MESRREFLKNASRYATPLIVTVAVGPSFAAGPYESPADGPTDPGGGGPITPGGGGPEGGGNGGVGTTEAGGDGGAVRHGSSKNWWERFIDQIEEI